MKLAIMQPYFFPYIGYYQMVGNCDLFISYDSVNYIQRGWINRNRILISKESKYITVPVCKNKLGTPISEIKISNFKNWKNKFLKTIELSYKNSPYFESSYNLINTVLSKKEFLLISELALESIKSVLSFLGFNVKYISSSKLKCENIFTRNSRLEYYIQEFNANQIILPPGSFDLYKEWRPKDCLVKTMKHQIIKYDQGQFNFIENLSIIDVLMYNNKEEIRNMITSISFR